MDPVNTETPATPAPVPENNWQPATPGNNEPVKTDVTPTPETPAELPFEDFIAGLMGDEGKETPPAGEAPKADPAPEATPDHAKENTELKEKLKVAEDYGTQFKPLDEAFKKDPVFKKFVDAVASGKVSFSGAFSAYLESQKGKTPAPAGSLPGDSPRPMSLTERQQEITRQKQIGQNDKRW